MKDQKQIMTWKEAFFSSPGPQGLRENLLLWIKGICMGSADIVPGVSGGTVALITGIYSQLLLAIQSVARCSLKSLFRFELKTLLSEIHLRFLLILLFGILTAILSLSRIMHHLLIQYPVLTWSLFLGLIGASVLIIGRKIENKLGNGGIFVLIGTVIAYFVVSMIPVQTPEALWFIFLSGMIAICAMILPGLSGAFLLLILGKYSYITGILKDPFHLDHLLIILVFVSGCLVGILSFSRVLNYTFSKYPNQTLALLTGFMLGSLKKIWPWKEVLESTTIRGKVHVLQEQNVLPHEFNGEFFLACGLMILGFLLVLFLQKFSDEENQSSVKVPDQL